MNDNPRTGLLTQSKPYAGSGPILSEFKSCIQVIIISHGNTCATADMTAHGDDIVVFLKCWDWILTCARSLCMIYVCVYVYMYVCSLVPRPSSFLFFGLCSVLHTEMEEW